MCLSPFNSLGGSRPPHYYRRIPVCPSLTFFRTLFDHSPDLGPVLRFGTGISGVLAPSTASPCPKNAACGVGSVVDHKAVLTARTEPATQLHPTHQS